MMDYELLYKQVKGFSEDRDNPVGVLANVSALIAEASGWMWVGFYIVHGEELWVGPFQGPVACMRIPFGRGVCGTAWKERRTLIVPDVEQFPGHIACSSRSRSEIVVPIMDNGEVVAVLDIDSERPDTFTPDDARGLEKICSLLAGTAAAYLRIVNSD